MIIVPPFQTRRVYAGVHTAANTTQAHFQVERDYATLSFSVTALAAASSVSLRLFLVLSDQDTGTEIWSSGTLTTVFTAPRFISIPAAGLLRIECASTGSVTCQINAKASSTDLDAATTTVSSALQAGINELNNRLVCVIDQLTTLTTHLQLITDEEHTS